jgi:hypothetical protein
MDIIFVLVHERILESYLIPLLKVFIGINSQVNKSSIYVEIQITH